MDEILKGMAELAESTRSGGKTDFIDGLLANAVMEQAKTVLRGGRGMCYPYCIWDGGIYLLAVMERNYRRFVLRKNRGLTKKTRGCNKKLTFRIHK